jgi:hypothetical protein
MPMAIQGKPMAFSQGLCSRSLSLTNLVSRKAENIKKPHKHHLLLTPWSRVLPEKLKRPELLKKYTIIYFE